MLYKQRQQGVNVVIIKTATGKFSKNIAKISYIAGKKRFNDNPV